MKILFSLTVLFVMAGCGIHVPVIDVATVTTETMQQAHGIKVIEKSNSSSYPEISETLGNITAYSCREMLNDPPPSKGDALMQLRLNAAAMGADGIKDLAYNSTTTTAFCLNCWETVKVTGVAVKFKK